MNLLHVLPLSFFHWCEAVWPGSWVKGSRWAFAIIETIHIMVLAVLLGTIFLIDLRLLGVGMKRRSPATLAEDLAPWTWTSIALMLITGAMLYSSEAVRLSQSTPFFYKMIFLLVALVLQTTWMRSITKQGMPENSGLGKAAAALSLFFWFGVAFAGRAIAFL